MEHTPIAPPGGPLESVERFLPTDIGIEPLSAVARALRGFNREQLGSAIEVLIALLDVAEPADDEPDFAPRSDGLPGDPGDHEPSGDAEEAAWIEWHQTHPGTRSQCQTGGHEDAEEGDAPEEDDDCGQCTEDEISSGWPGFGRPGPGCVISDPDNADDDTEPNGDEKDYSMAEDEPVSYRQQVEYGAGCSIADPGGCEHDGRELEDGY